MPIPITFSFIIIMFINALTVRGYGPFKEPEIELNSKKGIFYNLLLCFFGFFLPFLIFTFYSIPAAAQDNKTGIKELAISIAGKSGGSVEKTERILNWMYKNYKLMYTDYQKRTVAEIMKRGGGNCAELARVFQAFLGEVDIPTRWAAEISIVPKSERRKKDAESMVAETGVGASVFGYMHNDHRWLEVYDDSKNSWFPADPSTGIFGTDSWVKQRIGFGERPEAMNEWIVPFVIVVKQKKKIIENRSEYYLINGFNASYGKKLENYLHGRNGSLSLKNYRDTEHRL